MSKVLIAEDNPVSRELLREILATTNHEIVEAQDGQEALAKIAEAGPDLVLLDINMPIKDGFAVIRELRDQPRFARLPVMAITAYAMKQDRERILAAGFTSYLTKPIDKTKLFGEMQRFIQVSGK